MNPPAATIALVENDRATSTALRRLLQAHGYTVAAYFSGEAYLARLTPPRIDCLLLDVDLDGMSGLELQHRIAGTAQAVPIVFMTGRVNAIIEECAREHGCTDFLYKPFDSRTLVDALERAIAAVGHSPYTVVTRGTPC